MDKRNNASKNTTKKTVLPDFFRPIMWSYDFSKISASKDKKVIIINTINYGDLRHWKWIKENYGLEPIKEILSKVNATELRLPAIKLAQLLFSIKEFNYASRGAK